MKLMKLQNKVEKFCTENHLSVDEKINVVDLASEVGELSKEVLKSTNYGEVPFEKTSNFENELADVLFSLIKIANSTNTNLEKALMQAIEKYEKRLEKKQSISSDK